MEISCASLEWYCKHSFPMPPVDVKIRGVIIIIIIIIIVIIIIIIVNLINEMSGNYRCVRFVNLSMSSLGVFSNECSTFLDMMNDIGIDKK